MTGAWLDTDQQRWGAINYHWDGVRVTGRWTYHGSKGTGYDEWFPAAEDYIVPQLPSVSDSEDDSRDN